MDSSMWDDRYKDSELVWSATPNLFLPPLVEGVPPGTALDLACGEGRNAIWLAQHGWSVTGVDYSSVGIEKARKLAGETEVEWVVADVTTYEPETTFDLVVIFYLHLPADQIAGAFSRAVSAVAPGGTFFAVGHALSNLENGYGGPPYPEILWTPELLSPLLDGLDVIELGERERYVEAADATAIDLIAWGTRPEV
jgi:SAM-dependent methyltransferase